jgi:hypothetical protein
VVLRPPVLFKIGVPCLFQWPVRRTGSKHPSQDKAPPNSKFFVWLALLDRCWTFDRLLRHHMADNATCGLCSQLDESINHLLLGCSYSREVWACLLAGPGLHRLCPSGDNCLADWWASCRKKVPRCLRKGFDSWLLWEECNGRIFNNAMKQAAMLECWIREEAGRWVLRGRISCLSSLCLFVLLVCHGAQGQQPHCPL